MPKPSVGRIVHYTDNPVMGGGHARCFAAIVTGVNPDNTVDLQEFIASAIRPAYAIDEGPAGALYTWHWPERTED